ncbi:MAG: hypothetical protein IPM45_14585 [Acidimicrobiales bacterium]|nr:hypothetical protein [Acidimicrobiales bacterium]
MAGMAVALDEQHEVPEADVAPVRDVGVLGALRQAIGRCAAMDPEGAPAGVRHEMAVALLVERARLDALAARWAAAWDASGCGPTTGLAAGGPVGSGGQRGRAHGQGPGAPGPASA